MIRFDFKPKDKNLNTKYQRLEKCINEINLACTYEDIAIWEEEAINIIEFIANENRKAIDLMGGGLS